MFYIFLPEEKEDRGQRLRMENINNLLFTEASSVVTNSQLQNVTFLQNAFMVTFFTFLGLEGLKYFIGRE